MDSLTRQVAHPDDPTLDRALDRFLEGFRSRVERGGRSAATLIAHAQQADIIRASLPAGIHLEALTVAHVEQLAAAPVSGGTVRKRLATLYGALEAAKRRGELATLPDRPTVDYTYKPTTAHLRDLAELRRLCAELPEHRAEWVIGAVYSGMHASDLNAWRAYVDVDPFASPPWMTLRNTKNRKTDGLRVRMPRELARMLRERFHREGTLEGERALATWSNGTRGHQLADAGLRAGLEERITATSLRHTCGSWLVRRVGITPAAAAWLGHSSTAMLQRVYAHALPVQLVELTDELDSMGDVGAARRPSQQAFDGAANPSTAGNPSASMVGTEGPEGAATPSGPAQQHARGELRARHHRNVQQAIQPANAGGRSVPRDRVELSTHGFSEQPRLVASSIGGDATSALLDGGEPTCTPLAPDVGHQASTNTRTRT